MGRSRLVGYLYERIQGILFMAVRFARRQKSQGFINKCIDEAVENYNSAVEGIKFVTDYDTKGLTGSPNI